MTTTQTHGNSNAALEAALKSSAPAAAKAAPKAQTPEELAVAHGIASYQQLRSERDALQQKVNQLEQQLTVSKIEIEGLRATAAVSETRVETYQHERDNAVVDLAIYQTLFTTVQGIWRTFGVENAPLIKKITLPRAQQADDEHEPA